MFSSREDLPVHSGPADLRASDPFASSPLGAELARLRGPAPDGFADAVMAEVSSRRRPFGLGRREWAFVGASFGVWTLAILGLVTWMTSRMSAL